MEESFRNEKRVCVWSAADDRISSLPDSLISQMILLHLPTIDVVRTSVLSKKWKQLWLLTPCLDLDANEFLNYNAFVDFVNGFLDFSTDSCFHKVKLCIRRDVNDQSCLTRWIDSVVKRKLKHLDVECRVMRECLELIPVSLYICETLVYLRLHRVSMVDFESVSLPCLKIMRLERNIFANDAAIELLISSSPVLEDLSISRRVDDNIKVLRVYSQTLTSLSVIFHRSDDERYETEGTGVHIDAPRLEYLNFDDALSQTKTISNTGSLSKVDIVGAFNLVDLFVLISEPMRDMVRDFFASFSRVKDMLISYHTLEYFNHNSKLEVMKPLQQFGNVSRLEVMFLRYYLELLPELLESFPNLKSLVIDMIMDNPRELALSTVAPCLVSSLEYVEIKSRFFGLQADMELVRYIVENSVVLKKLVLHLSCSMEEQVFIDLLALPRRSTNCRIIFCRDR